MPVIKLDKYHPDESNYGEILINTSLIKHVRKHYWCGSFTRITYTDGTICSVKNSVAEVFKAIQETQSMTLDDIDDVLTNFESILRVNPYNDGCRCMWCGSNEAYKKTPTSKLETFPHSPNCGYARAKHYQLKLIKERKRLKEGSND